MTAEITQQQFQVVMGYNRSSFSGCGMDCPVERVNWHEVAAYTNELSRREGREACYECTGTAPSTIECRPSGSYATAYDCPGYRLPTEAEWEYAARAGTTTATYAGDLTAEDCSDTTLGPIAWFCGNGSSMTHPVGTKAANGFGLYDMLGNGWEWCHDWYADYPGRAETDPTGPLNGSRRMLRGASWNDFGWGARAAYREGNQPPDARYSNLGGRISRSSP